MQGFTYWADLNKVKLQESEHGVLSGWVHALPIGKFDHPIYGKLNFTAERVARFADNVKNKVRGIDLDIDYDHKEKDGKAAGWVKDADARPSGLWVFVEWTKEASQLIKDRAYRYFSAEFLDEWEEPESKKKHKDVLLGGGLTNRPFIKRLVPLNFNEVVNGGNVDRAELIKMLGLKDDASDDDIKAKLDELSKVKGGDGADLDLSKVEVSVDKEGKLNLKHPDRDEPVTVGLPQGVKVESGEGAGKEKEEGKEEEHEKELEKLAETNPAVAKLLNDNKDLGTRLGTLETAHRLSEVTTQLNEVGKDKKKTLPPVVVEKLRDIMVRLPKELSDKLVDAMNKLAEVGIVELGERESRTRDGKADDGNPITAFLTEVDKVQEESAKGDGKSKLSYREAVDKVRTEKPELYEAYEDAAREGSIQLANQ